MRDADLAQVVAIERTIYSHPWTRGNFADALRAGYQCRTLRLGRELIGYFVLMVAAGEAHLLNLSIAAPHQRRGHGGALLRQALAHGARGRAREACSSKCVRATWPRSPSTPSSASAASRCGAATTRRRRGARTRWCTRSPYERSAGSRS